MLVYIRPEPRSLVGFMLKWIIHKGKCGTSERRSIPRLTPSFVMIILFVFFAKYTMATSFNNPMVDAADLGDIAQVTKFLKDGDSPDSKGDFGVTPLMRAAFRGNTDIIQLLMESGAYVNAADVGGETALHLAAKNGHADAVKALLYYGAYIDVPDKENWTPLMRATLAKQIDTAQVLIDKGADIAAMNNINESVLVHAAIAGIPDIAALITGSPQAKKITKEQEQMAVDIAQRKNHKDVEKVLSMFIEKQDNDAVMVAENESIPDGAPLDIANPQLNDYTKASRLGSIPMPTIKPTTSNNYNTAVNDMDSRSNSTEEGRATAKLSDTAPPVVSNVNYKTGSKFFVQLGNFGDESSAERAWDKLSTRNTDVLFHLSPVIVKTVLEAGTEIFRLRAGTLTSKSEADTTCRTIRGRRAECFVVEVTDTPTSYASVPPSIQSPAQPVSKNTKPTDNSYGNYPKLAEVPASNNLPSSLHTQPLDTGFDKTPRSYGRSEPQAIPVDNYNAADNYQQTTDDSLEEYTSKVLPWHKDGYQPPQELAQNDYGYQDSPIMENAPPVYQAQNNYPSARPSQFPSQMQAPAYPQQYNTPQPLNDDFVENKGQIRNEIQEMTRENFFRKQGIKPPERKKEEYEDFYKQVEAGQNQRPVSEAVLVPDETYFSDSIQSGGNQMQPNQGGSWLNISNLPSKEFADDYGMRMFKSDQSLGNVQVKVSRAANGATVMFVGPVTPLQADNLCNIVKAGGMNCSTTGGQSSGYGYNSIPEDNSPFAQTRRSLAYWINLGTFANEAEAEYYWMFLKEDNGDILGPLQYSLEKATNYGEFGYGAIQLRTGPFDIKQRASQICSIMRYRNIACLLTE